MRLVTRVADTDSEPLSAVSQMILPLLPPWWLRSKVSWTRLLGTLEGVQVSVKLLPLSICTAVLVTARGAMHAAWMAKAGKSPLPEAARPMAAPAVQGGKGSVSVQR